MDGVSYPKVYEAMLDSGYTKDRVKLVGTNRDNSPLVFSTHYSNIRVDGASFASANAAISRLNQVVFSKGGGSGDGGTTGDYIPLSGTEEGKPVTGHLQLDGEPYVSIYSGNIDGGEKFASINFYKNIDVNGNCGLDFGVDAYDWEGYSYANWVFGTGMCEDELTEIKYNGFEIQTTNDGNGGLGVGVFSNDDYSDVAPSNKLIYTQRSYVDRAVSYSTTETKTGGTWIDGKPIYRKVISFNGNNQSTININYNIPNLEYIVFYDAYIKTSSNIVKLPNTLGSGSVLEAYVNLSTGQIKVFWEEMISSAASFKFIIEYTKTTSE